MFEQTFKNIDDVLRKEAGCATELDYAEQTSWMLFLKYLDDLEEHRRTDAELTNRAYAPLLDEAHRWSAWAAPKKANGQFDHDRALTGEDLIEFVNGNLFPYLKGFRQRATGPQTIEYKIGEIFSEMVNKFRSGYSLRDALELIDELRFRSQNERHELSALYETRIKNMGNAGRNGGEYYKVRKFQHISATSFWGPDGKPMSAAQFVESLFGVLPQLFKDEAELRKLWSDPETRKRLLEGLAERGFTRDQLNSIRSVVDAEASDLFDVLAYVAYVRAPETREERVATRRAAILDGLSEQQRGFLDFVLSQYVAEGEDELDPAKLPALLNVKYGSSSEGLHALGGSVREVQESFRGFQGKLYAEEPKH